MSMKFKKSFVQINQGIHDNNEKQRGKKTLTKTTKNASWGIDEGETVKTAWVVVVTVAVVFASFNSPQGRN